MPDECQLYFVLITLGKYYLVPSRCLILVAEVNHPNFSEERAISKVKICLKIFQLKFWDLCPIFMESFDS